MRIAVFILAILGALAAAALGITWLSEASEVSAELAALAGDTFTSLVTAGWLLIVAFALGIIGGVLALLRRGRHRRCDAHRWRHRSRAV